MFFLVLGGSLAAQSPNWELSIRLVDKDSSFLQEKKITYKPIATSQNEVQQTLKNIRLQLAQHSFLCASVDSMRLDSNHYTAYFQVGNAFKWAKLNKGNVSDEILDAIGFKERFYTNKPFYYSEWVQLMKQLQTYTENNGYPFAEVRLDSISIQADHSIIAQLHLQTNQLIRYKGIEIIGEKVKISKAYLQHYLGIKPNELYNLQGIKEIPQRIRELPFVKETKKPVITFKGTEATINLFLEKRKSSQFDFLVGVLPSNDPNRRRLLLTIDGMFAAQNLLGAGEKIHFEFRQIKAGTQRLDIELGYPYMLGMPFGTEGEFSLYKRDSTFLDLEYNVGFSYFFDARQYLKAFGHSKQTNLLSVNKQQIIQQKKLPQNLDTRFTDFGLEYHWERLDYKNNPKKGFSLTSRTSAGFRSIQKNNEIIALSDPNQSSFRFESLYDSVKLRTFQYKIDQNVQWFIPFFPKDRGVIMLGNNTGGIFSPQAVFLNEQYRIGGNKRLRGFDEEAIHASLFSIFTLEYRFLLGQNSYLYLFGDYGYVESRSPEKFTKDTPLGFGAGLAFDTPLGVFGISLAYGQQNGIPIDFRAAKIHFGYVSYF